MPSLSIDSMQLNFTAGKQPSHAQITCKATCIHVPRQNTPLCLGRKKKKPQHAALYPRSKVRHDSLCGDEGRHATEQCFLNKKETLLMSAQMYETLPYSVSNDI